MSLSLIIPTYTLNPELEELAIRALISYHEQPDEIIVVEDGGMFSPKIMALADTYIYNKDNKGFTANVNRGWRYATGDFVAIVNSDTELREGNLYDLCVRERVTSPEIINEQVERLAGPFFVVPKEIRDARGMLLEELKTYCSDSEYDNRVADIFQIIPSVRVLHHKSQTVQAAGIESGTELERDRKTYDQLKKGGLA